MSTDIDSLENLSNVELRALCKEHGLPNVPITDSSRNVLIKKLRASLTGTTQKPKSARRETIHVTKNNNEASAPPKESNEGSRTPSRGRRTIAGTPTLDSQPPNERALVTEKAAPVNVRRRSVREPDHQPPSSQQQQQSQQPQARARNVSRDERPPIIIESDEEDEQELLRVAAQADMYNRPTTAQEAARKRNSRSVSLSKTGVVTTSYNQEVSVPPRIAEEEPVQRSSFVSTTTTAPTITGLYPNLFQSGTRNFMTEPVPIAERRAPTYTQSSNRYTMDAATTTRYNPPEPQSYYSPPNRYSISAASPAAASSAATMRSKASMLYNEQSDTDGGNAEEEFQTPFLSSFARNLERLKTEPVGRSSFSSLSSGLTGSADYSDARRLKRNRACEITGRRPTNDSVKESLRQLLLAMDRKYHLKFYLTLFGIFVLVVFLYVLFFQ